MATYVDGLECYRAWCNDSNIDLAKCIKNSSGWLQYYFSIRNMSIIERFHLKSCVEESLVNLYHEIKSCEAIQILTPQNLPEQFCYQKEAGYRWLNRICLLTIPEIDREFNKKSGVSKQFQLWIMRTRYQSHLM